jgi:predicted transposase YbfD/YdcC
MQTQIELRQIDGQPFVITRQGKREFIRTVAEQIAIEERELASCMASIADAQIAALECQKAIEDALLNGETAVTHRAQLAASNEIISGFTHDAGESRDCIREIYRMVDGHAVEVIRQADADRLNALSKPYAEILKENQ